MVHSGGGVPGRRNQRKCRTGTRVDNVVAVYLDTDTFARVTAIADRDGQSLSATGAKLMLAGLKKQ